MQEGGPRPDSETMFSTKKRGKSKWGQKLSCLNRSGWCPRKEKGKSVEMGGKDKSCQKCREKKVGVGKETPFL